MNVAKGSLVPLIREAQDLWSSYIESVHKTIAIPHYELITL